MQEYHLFGFCICYPLPFP